VQDRDTFGKGSTLGVNPVSEGLGATVLSTGDASGHSAYSDEGSESLRHLVRIGVGVAPR
jgi:hypothetical protein